MTTPDYLVHARLGSGSTGANFRVTRREDGCQIALKVLHNDLLDGVDLEHMQKAIDAIGKVKHAAVASEMCLSKWRGDLVLTRQFYQGVDLGTLVGSSVMAPRAALEAAFEVGSGLQAVRDVTGFSHGDLKPSNIFVDGQGGLYLVDFALARAATNQGERTLTMLHTSVGFMPPERIDNQETDTADLYSLALLTIWMLTGKIPKRTSANPKRHEERRRTLIDGLYAIPGLPEGLGSLIDRATAYEATKRPQMTEFLDALTVLTPQAIGTDFKGWSSPIVSGLIVEDDETPITDTGGPLSNPSGQTPNVASRHPTPLAPGRAPRIQSRAQPLPKPAVKTVQPNISSWAVALVGVGMILLAAAIAASILFK